MDQQDLRQSRFANPRNAGNDTAVGFVENLHGLLIGSPALDVKFQLGGNLVLQNLTLLIDIAVKKLVKDRCAGEPQFIVGFLHFRVLAQESIELIAPDDIFCGLAERCKQGKKPVFLAWCEEVGGDQQITFGF